MRMQNNSRRKLCSYELLFHPRKQLKNILWLRSACKYYQRSTEDVDLL